MRSIGIALSFGIGLLACVSLKMADETTPTSTEMGPDASGTNDASAGANRDGNVEPPDAGTPPTDFACADTWKAATKVDARCSARIVTIVDEAPSFDANGIGIARTRKGRVGIVYATATSADSSDMKLAHFSATGPPFSPTILARSQDFVKMGASANIVATGDDTLVVLSHDVEGDSGPLNVLRLVNGASAFSSPELVNTAVADGTQLGFAVDHATDNLYATMLLKQTVDGGIVGRIAARQWTGGGAWMAMADLAMDLPLAAYSEIGATSLVVDLGGQLHAVHQAATFATSTPRYQEFDGTLWTARKTLDNAASQGYAGFSPRLAVFGLVKHAAYFYEGGGQATGAHADLRVATWQGANDLPTIEVLRQTFTAPATPPQLGDAPLYRVAMDVDKYGLLHLLYVLTYEDGSADLVYDRQARDATGSLTWLEDVIARDVGAPGEKAFVDLLLDENARPHIAYRSGTDYKIYYATRTDR